MKILDCFIFNDENEILKIRFNTLNSYVDKFIIVESLINHQGKRKKRNFNINLFKKFKKKIYYLLIKKIPKNFSSWQIENFQRNYISNALKKFSKEDIVIISDADEIPNLKNFDFSIIKNNYYSFEQDHFFYKLNLKQKEKWLGSKMCKIKDLKSPQWLRSLKMHKKYSYWRIDKYFSKNYVFNFEIIKNGGWHFGWLKNINKIILKIDSYAHIENNLDINKNKKFIEKCINKKINFLNINEKLKKVKIDNSFPYYIKNNLHKFKKWIV